MTLIDCTGAQCNSALAAISPAGHATLGRYVTPYQAARISTGMLRVQHSATVFMFGLGAGNEMVTTATNDRIPVKRHTAEPTHMIHFEKTRSLSSHKESTCAA